MSFITGLISLSFRTFGIIPCCITRFFGTIFVDTRCSWIFEKNIFFRARRRRELDASMSRSLDCQIHNKNYTSNIKDFERIAVLYGCVDGWHSCMTWKLRRKTDKNILRYLRAAKRQGTQKFMTLSTHMHSDINYIRLYI